MSVKANTENKKTHEPSAPEVSVIIPVYNREDYIADTVGSVLSGTYKDFEIILVDDGSDDESLNICRTLEKKDTRIRVIESDHGGVSAARNKGLDNAGGKYIAFIDSDDRVEPGYLQSLVGAVKQDGVDYALCSFSREFRSDGEIFHTKDAYYAGTRVIKEKYDLIDACLEPCPGHIFRVATACMSLFRRDIIEEQNIRFSEEVVYGEDTMFLYTYAHYIRGFAYVDENLYIYLQHDSNTANTRNPIEFVDISVELIDAMDKLTASFGESRRRSHIMFKREMYANCIFKINGDSNTSLQMAALERLGNDYRVRCKDLRDYYTGERIAIAVALWLLRRNMCRTIRLLSRGRGRLATIATGFKRS